MDWKFKETTISSDDFWYDLFEGGYIKPESVLEDETQIEKVKEAIDLLESFKYSLEANEILEYY